MGPAGAGGLTVPPHGLADLTSALVRSVAVPSRGLGRFEAAWEDARCCGPAVTVRGVGGDNLAIYHGLAATRPGDVLVVSLNGSTDAGHWGGLLTRAARNAELAGVVVDGAVRDRAEFRQLGVPVFFRGLCPRKAGKEHRGVVGGEVPIGEDVVRAGDIVVADVDGLAAFAAADHEAMLAATAEIVAAEAAIESRLAAGAGLGEAFGLSL
jgi:4-hydroxy-4-methyl-2-oxoglutarate aldolase